MRNVSMRDVAAKLGVSVMTVSNVLRGQGRVAEETSQRVLTAAKDMGFRKDVFASFNSSKRAKSQKSLTVAFNAKQRVEAADEHMHLYRDIYFRLLERLRETGDRLVLTDRESGNFALELALADVIVEFGGFPQEELSTSNAQRVCAFFEEPGCFSVQPDNEAAGRMAAELLIKDMGYERIAVCKGNSVDQMLRYKSFSRHCRELLPSAHVECFPAGSQPLRDIMTCPAAERFDALFVLWGNGLRLCCSQCWDSSIPRGLNLLSFDNFQFYDWLPVAVSRYYFDPLVFADAIADAVAAASAGRSPMKFIVPIHYKEGNSLVPNRNKEVNNLIPSHRAEESLKMEIRP